MGEAWFWWGCISRLGYGIRSRAWWFGLDCFLGAILGASDGRTASHHAAKMRRHSFWWPVGFVACAGIQAAENIIECRWPWEWQRLQHHCDDTYSESGEEQV